MTPTSIAIVSSTGTARKRTLPSLSRSPVHVRAVHGRRADALEEVRARFSIPESYTDLDEMLHSSKVDFVFVASPPFLHKRHVSACLQAGIPVLVEKPLAHNLADARAIALEAATTGVEIRIAHHLRHQHAFEWLRDLLSRGLLGLELHCSFEWSVAMNRQASSASWKLDPLLNGITCLSDAGVHCLDMSIGLFGPGRIMGATSTKFGEDRTREMVDVLVAHERSRVRVCSSRVYGAKSNDLRVVGERGSILIQDFFGEAAATSGVLTLNGNSNHVEFSPSDPYSSEIEDFASLLSGGESNGTTVEEAVNAMEMVDAVAAGT